MPMMLIGCLRLGETDQSEHETSVSCFKKKKKNPLFSDENVFFSLHLIHVTVHFMLTRNKCENKKLRSAISNWKVKYIIKQKQKKKQPTGFS